MKPTASDIFEAAALQGVSAAKIAILSGVRADFNMWQPIREAFTTEVATEAYVKDLRSGQYAKDSFISKYVTAVANEIQFPANTLFAHMLGCVSSAMVHRFDIDYYGGDLHPGLYIVTSQPPSSGKSGVNQRLQDPISVAMEKVNKANAKERAKINLRIAKFKEQQKASSGNVNEAVALQESIQQEEEKLEFFPIYKYEITDATPEAISQNAGGSGGVFTLISEEATIINNAFGAGYGGKGGPVNNEILLKGWDGGRVASSRITRETCPPFSARGAISVIAQDEVVLRILQDSERGNGLSERFLVVNEGNMLGSRVFVDDNMKLTYKGVDSALKAEYINMVNNLAIGDKVRFTMTGDALLMIALKKQEIEKDLGDNGKYGNSLLRGTMGKLDKQVCKLAAVLHATKHWRMGGSMSTVIDDSTVAWAIEIFMELSKAFISASEREGYSGNNTEFEKVVNKIIQKSKNGTPIKVKSIYDALRGVVPFKGYSNFGKKLKESILPALEKCNYLIVHKEYIYPNPELFRG